MFDIGFLELIIVAVIALLILGPERLPEAARTTGKWFGKARRMVNQFSREIDRQLEAEELREKLKKQGESLNINEDVQKIQHTVHEALREAHDYEPLPREEEVKEKGKEEENGIGRNEAEQPQQESAAATDADNHKPK